MPSGILKFRNRVPIAEAEEMKVEADDDDDDDDDDDVDMKGEEENTEENVDAAGDEDANDDANDPDNDDDDNDPEFTNHAVGVTVIRFDQVYMNPTYALIRIVLNIYTSISTFMDVCESKCMCFSSIYTYSLQIMNFGNHGRQCLMVYEKGCDTNIMEYHKK